jgi:hypothetical protein
VRGLVCENERNFKNRDGGISKCKIGFTEVVLPKIGNLKLKLVVCKGLGEKPLVLDTNSEESLESLAVSIVKTYLLRWKIEEFYAFKKQELNFEDFRVRSLEAIKTLDILLTIALGYLGTICDNVGNTAFSLKLITVSKRVRKLSAFLKETKLF